MERIRVENEAEAAEAVRDFAARGVSLEIVSGGSKRACGRPVEADALLEVSALSGIVSYEPDELVITVRAATKLAEVDAALAAKKQMLAFSPVDWGPLFGGGHGRATLAGIVATNGTGSRRIKAGAVRDHLIGCRFVNGAGEIIRAGGRVVKNVSGFDIPKLMCGAFGTLGVLTELTFRVAPLAERAPAVKIRCGAEDGLRLLRQVAGLAVEPTGLAYLAGEGCAFTRVEGSEAAVADKLSVLNWTFANQGPELVDDRATAKLFRDAGNGAVLANAGSDLWRLVVPSSAAYEAVTASGAGNWYADWAGGLLWLALPGDALIAERLHGITARLGGHATLMRASEAARAEAHVFAPEPPARAALTRSVKAAFDPGRVLNPGRMYRDV
jgi:glycolate oxidase FAD binding subunit